MMLRGTVVIRAIKYTCKHHLMSTVADAKCLHVRSSYNCLQNVNKGRVLILHSFHFMQIWNRKA